MVARLSERLELIIVSKVIIIVLLIAMIASLGIGLFHLLKAPDENDNGDKYVKVGSMKDRPTYQDVEKLLDEKGVGYKYARDLGMAPKL